MPTAVMSAPEFSIVVLWAAKKPGLLLSGETGFTAAFDAGRAGDRPGVGAGARGAEGDFGLAGGGETGACADVELALVRDTVAAFSARYAGGLGRGGERAAGAARAAEGD